MIPQKPYFIRAMYDWIVDNEWTPYIQVDVNWPGAEVPQQFVEDGTIVLNISPMATRNLNLGNDEISFRARFQGEDRQVRFPPEAVLAIFARETGQGMPFPPEPYPEKDPEPKAAAPEEKSNKPKSGNKVVHLKRVK
jgi:stringent starvation protein B